MRFVSVKSEEQQGVLMLHRARELLVRQRTMLINALRAHLAELGIATRLGPMGVKDAVALIEHADHHLIPEIVRRALSPLCDQLRHVHTKIEEMDRQILEWHRSSAISQRLATIPGIGSVTASAIAATITDVSSFHSGRQLAAWIGLVPRHSSSGGKERLGRITRQGDPYIRRLLVIGATAVLRFSRKSKAASTQWATELLERKPGKVAAVALAHHDLIRSKRFGRNQHDELFGGICERQCQFRSRPSTFLQTDEHFHHRDFDFSSAARNGLQFDIFLITCRGHLSLRSAI
ncbi:hypothetical protein BA011_34095 (plasmid) [Rhizobium leguminosarum]|uniref:Transposase IS116/IS110/IS902 C-terminal domain-containing protein n=1 Tax=Rhizobium leguminosarum TaxID=384 RepID=A0A1B1CMG1_RHILE|nr:hypothetical protein BA011_34095 [Rhizobium leguminosarum]